MGSMSENDPKSSGSSAKTPAEQAETYESAEQSRLLLDAVLDQSPVGMMVLSLPDLVLRRINRAAVEGLGIGGEPTLLNLPLQEIVRRKNWQEAVTTDSKQRSPNWVERVLRGEATPSFEFAVVRKD